MASCWKQRRLGGGGGGQQGEGGGGAGGGPTRRRGRSGRRSYKEEGEEGKEEEGGYIRYTCLIWGNVNDTHPAQHSVGQRKRNMEVCFYYGRRSMAY